MSGLLASLVLLTCGDSLTAGGSWQTLLAGSPTVANCGVYGATSWHAATGLDSQSFGYVRAALAAHPEAEAIVLWYGTNDVRWPDWADTGHDGTLRLVHTLTRASLEQMADDALAVGLPVVLVVPPPIIAWPGGTTALQEAEWNASIKHILRPHIREIAARRRIPVADLYAAFERRDAAGLMECLYVGWNNSGDGVHMGQVACPDGKSAAQVIAPVIDRALARALAPR